MDFTNTQTSIPKLSAKFFFLSLGVLVSLIASVSSFLVLLFEALNKKFPDALNAVYQYGYNTYNFETMRGALATLIIVFPVFLIISYFWNKATKVELGHYDVIIRKWMIYLILFIASIVIIVDLVTLVRYFVSGEITARFILKVVGTLAVAALGGFYYTWELRKKAEMAMSKLPLIVAIISSALALFVIIYSFTVMGSPKQQRAWRFDERRIQDLQSIQWQVINYWQQKEKMPETLADMANPLSGFSVPVDPEVQKGKSYEYAKTGKMSFALCATFSEAIPKGWQEYSNGGGIMPMMEGRDVAVSSYPYPGPGGVNESWDHEAGRTCFERTIDKDLYPPYPKPLY